MATRHNFGWHSGNLDAANLVAGSFTVSGNATITNSTLVPFTYDFKTTPDCVEVTQVDQSTTVASGATIAAMISGNRFVVSGITISGFTLKHVDSGIGPFEFKYKYIAFDYTLRGA